MLLRCKTTFETRESGIPLEVEKGTVWMKTSHSIARGGYELVNLKEVDATIVPPAKGRFTGVTAKVRIERLEDFEVVGMYEISVPTTES